MKHNTSFTGIFINQLMGVEWYSLRGLLVWIGKTVIGGKNN